MIRYFVELAYDGTSYHGWQIQQNAHTVQAELEKVFSLIFSQKLKITGAGRTDTGVHAEHFVAHFELQNPIENIEKYIFKLNRFLPEDIVIYKIYKVNENAHSRFSATKRRYRYRIVRHKSPFKNKYSHHVFGNLNVELMQEAADILLQYDDFTSFSRLHSNTNNNICQIFSAEFHQQNDMLYFEIEANRFLRNMVRAIMGTLLDVGQNKIQVQDIHSIIKAKNRSIAGASAPAKGLSLIKIEYPNDIY